MCEAVAPLNEAQVEELAAYYSALPRVSSKEDYNKKLAAVGKLIHDDLCAKCHVLPTNDDVENALGIPLNGQRAAYLRLALGAYLTGDRETLVPIMADKLQELDQDKDRCTHSLLLKLGPGIMNSLQTWTTFFGWLTVVNIGIYLFIVVAHYRHARLCLTR